MPCSDIEQENSFEKVSVENNTKGKCHDDVCSPFCVCNCIGCQGFLINNVYAINILTIKKEIRNTIPEYKATATSSANKSIWQPPQII